MEETQVAEVDSGVTPEEGVTPETPIESEGVTLEDDMALQTLKRERELRKEAEKRARKAQANTERIERERLAEQGKYKELHEQSQEKLHEMEAEKARTELDAGVREALSDAKLPEFTDLVMGRGFEDKDEAVEYATKIKAMIDERVEKEIPKRIDTGTRPQTPDAGAGPPKEMADIKTAEEWATYKKAHGIE